MFLKRLEIQGFKSFAEFSELYFGPGITCVVGPNGCGKSNIYDAINWVLGEQRARSLRGTKMEDLIFAGSSQLKAMGMAEVSLTFGDAESLKLDLSEVTVTRRLYRTGESEYLVNKKPCRLKDILDIFANTGVGLNSYSMMEQGKVDLIINSKPIERRDIFEEAAGISKYRQQKEEALRKLDYTRANLTRLHDIIEEITRQMNSVNRHAAKARRYQKLFDQLRTYEIVEGKRRYDFLSGQMESGASGAGQLQAEQQQLRDRVRELGDKLSEHRLLIGQKEHRMSELQKNLNLLIGQITEAEGKIRYNASRVEDLTRRLEFLKTEEDRIGRTIGDYAAKIEEAARREGELGGQAAAEKQALDQAAAGQAEVEAKIEALRRELSAVREREAQARRRIADKTNRIHGAQAQVRLLHTRIEKIRGAQHTLSLSFEEDEKTLACFTQTISTLRASLEEATGAYTGLDRAIKDAKSRRDILEYKLVETLKLIAEEESKHKFLSGLKESFEGYRAGVKALLTQVKSGALKLDGPCQTVADILHVPEEHALAVEAALGERAQDLVVGSVEDANRCIEFLKQNNLGKLRFIVSGLFGVPDSGRAPVFSPSGAAGRLIDRIPYDKVYEGVVEFLLGEALIVSDVRAAFEEVRRAGAACTLIGAEGDLMAAPAVWIGGSAKKAPAGILVRDRQIQAAEEQRRKLDAVREDLQKQIQALKDEEGHLGEEAQKCRVRIDEAQKNLVSQQTQQQALDIKHSSSRRAYSANDSEIGEVERQIVELEREEEACQHEIAGLSEEEHALTENAAAIEKTLAETEEQRRAAAEKNTECRIRYSTIGQQQAHLAGSIAEYRTSAQRLESELAARRCEQEEAQKLMETLRTESEQFDRGAQESRAQKTAADQAVAAVEAELAGERAGLETLAGEQEQLRQRLEAIGSENARREVEQAELRINRENLLQRLREEYRFDLTIDTLEQAQIEVPEENLGEEIVRLKEKIRELGPVNMAAVDEYKELEDRYNFLIRQKEDLEASEKSLREAIEEINKTSTEMFVKSFEEVRGNFRKSYSMLFPGGEADLLLTDPQSILDSGIEIEAKPAGKKKQNLSLLSGGEKAMTSIALLFALFLSKPSPFCIMDEVDAPLDDTNISRFVDTVKDFSSNTQFVIVTHNKKTMAAAREIYGVSMDRSGSSKIISLQFSSKSDGQLTPA